MATFVVMSELLKPRLDAFMVGAQAKITAYDTEMKNVSTTKLVMSEPGPRYIRLVREDWFPGQDKPTSRSVYCFVDKTNGDLLKGDWKAPVKKGVRGNLNDADYGLSKFGQFGPLYLR